MQRKALMLAVAALMLMVAFAGAMWGTTAHAAPPAADPPIAIQTLGTGAPSNAPGMALVLLRITIQPGGAFPSHTHPGALVIAVESGDFGFTVLDGEAQATRGVASGTPQPAETLTAGNESILHAGDEIFEQAGVLHTARNAGTTPVIVLVSGLVDPTQEFLHPMEMPATPAA